ncbi:hypothetical protein B0H10DRAFT_2217429 [Mycena sp. CBHHK59/15]|nr:hypothetical protein B0H10DRAFT_2217429 [Mycena sp. CBHHK59/15]
MALQYLWQSTTLPIPRVLDFVREPNTTGYYLATIRLEGQYAVIKDLQNAVAQLQSIPSLSSPSVCSFSGAAFLSFRISESFIGPFPDVHYFHQHLFSILHAKSDIPALRVLAQKSHNKTHRLCFTHGDLNPTNILILNGRVSGIVDWEVRPGSPSTGNIQLYHGSQTGDPA